MKRPPNFAGSRMLRLSNLFFPPSSALTLFPLFYPSLAILIPLYRLPEKDSKRFWRNCRRWPKSIWYSWRFQVSPYVLDLNSLYQQYPSFDRYVTARLKMLDIRAPLYNFLWFLLTSLLQDLPIKCYVCANILIEEKISEENAASFMNSTWKR